MDEAEEKGFLVRISNLVAEALNSRSYDALEEALSRMSSDEAEDLLLKAWVISVTAAQGESEVYDCAVFPMDVDDARVREEKMRMLLDGFDDEDRNWDYDRKWIESLDLGSDLLIGPGWRVIRKAAIRCACAVEKEGIPRKTVDFALDGDETVVELPRGDYVFCDPRLVSSDATWRKFSKERLPIPARDGKPRGGFAFIQGGDGRKGLIVAFNAECGRRVRYGVNARGERRRFFAASSSFGVVARSVALGRKKWPRRGNMVRFSGPATLRMDGRANLFLEKRCGKLMMIALRDEDGMKAPLDPSKAG